MLTRRHLKQKYLRKTQKCAFLVDDVPEDEDLTWPPIFQTYDLFYEEIIEAIRMHAEFGEWLKERLRCNVDALNSPGFLRLISAQPPHETIIDALKKEYVRQKTKQNENKYCRIIAATWELERNQETYDKCQREYDDNMDIYNRHVESVKQLIQNRPSQATRFNLHMPRPAKPCLLERRDRLREMIEKGASVDAAHSAVSQPTGK